MGLFFDHIVHQIDSETICTLRKLPESDGMVSRIVRGRNQFDVYKIACKPIMRKSYHSGRVVMVYSIKTLVDGKYEAITLGEENKKVKHQFLLVNGLVQTELDGIEELISETEEA